MKLKIFLSLVLISLILNSCLFKSFNPFYLEEDIAYDENIIGSWIDQDSVMWNFEQFSTTEKFPKKTVKKPFYLLKYMEESGKLSKFKVTLFRLGDALYLDFFPELETISEYEFLTLHTMPVHSLAKLEITDEKAIAIKWFNEDWLGKLIEDGKTDIKHERIHYGAEEGTIVLTASTDELRLFIMRFGTDPDAFKCHDKLTGDSFCNKLIRSK
jgi:hypothetical protein